MGRRPLIVAALGPGTSEPGGARDLTDPGRVRRVAFGSAISEHPITAVATGEVSGAVFERVGEGPELALVFVTPAHGGALEDVVRTVDAVLRPDVVLGAVAQSVVGPGREVERGPGISLWAGSVGPVAGMSLGAPDEVLGPGPFGWPTEMAFEPKALLLLADPFTFPAEDFLSWIAHEHPGMPVIGALAAAANTIGGNSLSLGDKIQRSGAVGVALGPGAVLEPLVSQGCRPFGRPLVVTRSEHNVIYELGGKPALERLVSQARSDLTEDEIDTLANGGLQLGRVIDEHREEFASGDFLIRGVLGTDRRSGAVVVGDVVPVGVTVQFHLRDPATADEDLIRNLAGCSADAALLFTCTGRGTRLFGGPDHDAEAIVDLLGPIPTAGCFAAGEIGPVGGRNFLHGFTASLALFSDAKSGSRSGGTVTS
jgi:small ligand-binding sensory domain FIST